MSSMMFTIVSLNFSEQPENTAIVNHKEALELFLPSYWHVVITLQSSCLWSSLTHSPSFVSLTQNSKQYWKHSFLGFLLSELPTLYLEVILLLLDLGVGRGVGGLIYLNFPSLHMASPVSIKLAVDAGGYLYCYWISFIYFLSTLLTLNSKDCYISTWIFLSGTLFLPPYKDALFLLFNILHQLCLTTLDPFKDLVKEPWKYNLIVWYGPWTFHLSWPLHVAKVRKANSRFSRNQPLENRELFLNLSAVITQTTHCSINFTINLVVYRDVSYLGQPHKLVLSILVNSWSIETASSGSLLPLDRVCVYACIWGGNGSRGVGCLKKKRWEPETRGATVYSGESWGTR